MNAPLFLTLPISTEGAKTREEEHDATTDSRATCSDVLLTALDTMDEPTVGVDVQSRRALWDYVLDLKGRGKTVLITTNYLEEANALCDRLAILDQGKLVALDTPANLKRRYGESVIEMQVAQPLSLALLERLHRLPGVAEVTQEQGVVKVTLGGESAVTGPVVTLALQETALRSITQREPTLDEVFLRLTGTTGRE